MDSNISGETTNLTSAEVCGTVLGRLMLVMVTSMSVLARMSWVSLKCSLAVAAV